jgi:DNA polymerase-3 subunit epsilon
MEEDFEAHRADQDTEATYRVLMGQLDYYTEEKQRALGEDPEGRVLQNDMDCLAEFSKANNNVDFAGRIVWGEAKDAQGNVILDKDGKPQMVEYFNFGKHKGKTVAEVLRFDTGYYGWMMAGDFSNNTKQVLTRIRLREAKK